MIRPATFVPPHVHPTQDEFIYMLEGTFDLYLDGKWVKAGPGDLVRMPMDLPHGYYNTTDKATRALFWVTPARKLKELFDQLHNLADVEEVVRRSAAHEVDFLPPGSVPGASRQAAALFSRGSSCSIAHEAPMNVQNFPQLWTARHSSRGPKDARDAMSLPMAVSS